METPQHGNISTREFPFYFGKSLKTGIVEGFPNILRRFLIFKVEVFPLFLGGISVFFEAFPFL